MAAGEGTSIGISTEGGVGVDATSPGTPYGGSDDLTQIVKNMKDMAAQAGVMSSQLKGVVDGLKAAGTAANAFGASIGGKSGSTPGNTGIGASGLSTPSGGGGGSLLEMMRSLNMTFKEMKVLAPDAFKTVTSQIQTEVTKQKAAVASAVNAYQTSPTEENAAAVRSTTADYRALSGFREAQRQERAHTISAYQWSIAGNTQYALVQGVNAYYNDQISKDRQAILQERVVLANEYSPFQQTAQISYNMQRMAQAGMSKDFAYLFAAGKTSLQSDLIGKISKVSMVEQDKNIEMLKKESDRQSLLSKIDVGGGALVAGLGLLGATVATGGVATVAALAVAAASAAHSVRTGVDANAKYQEDQLKIKEMVAQRRGSEFFKDQARQELMQQNMALFDPYYMSALSEAVQSAPGMAAFERRFGIDQVTAEINRAPVLPMRGGRVMYMGTPLSGLGVAKYEDVVSASQQIGAMFGYPYGESGKSNFTGRLDRYMRFGMSAGEVARLTNEFTPGRDLIGAGAASDTAFNVAYNVTGSTDTALAAANAASRLGYGVGGVTGSPQQMTNLILGMAGGSGATAFSIQQAEETARATDRFGRSPLSVARSFSMLSGTGANMVQASRLASASVRELLYGSKELTRLGITKDMTGAVLKARASSLDIMKSAFGATTIDQQAALLSNIEGFEGLSDVQRRGVVQMMLGKPPSAGGKNAVANPPNVNSTGEVEETVREEEVNRRGLAGSLIAGGQAKDAAALANEAARMGGGGVKGPQMPNVDDSSTTALNNSIVNVAKALDGLAQKLGSFKLR
jgi:hypothetical protein